MIGFPMLFTMFIAGMWHGAGFQFIVFGLLHGAYLTVNHAWRVLFHRRVPDSPPGAFIRTVKHVERGPVTLLCVVVSFVAFRSRGMGQAISMLGAMIGLDGSTFHTASVRLSLLQDAAFQHKLMTIAFGAVIVWCFPQHPPDSEPL